MELAILWKAFLAGFGIGILGSLHCVGMCGPLALSLPVVQGRGMRFAGIKILLYNIGRVMSYTAIGLGMGIIGFSFALYNLQRWLSIGSGLIILGIAVMQFRQVRHIVLLEGLYEGVSRKISGLLSGKESPGKYLSLGIANGFLPCGLVYVALVTALSTGRYFSSAAVMMGFGVGTVPLMWALMFLGRRLPAGVGRIFQRSVPYVLLVLGLLLIMRGMNLGIPFISPEINEFDTAKGIRHCL